MKAYILCQVAYWTWDETSFDIVVLQLFHKLKSLHLNTGDSWMMIAMKYYFDIYFKKANSRLL